MTDINRRQALTAVAGGAAALMGGSPGAFAQQETRLLFASLASAGTRNSTHLIAPWVQKVNELGKGNLVVEQRDGVTLANFRNSYDRVLSDVVQISWGLQPSIGGKFVLSEVAGLPGPAHKNEHTAAAFWRLYKTGLLDSEYDQVVPIWLASSPAAAIHFAKKPKSTTDLSGLKVNVFNRTLFSVVERLGGTPLSLQPEAQYEALQRGTVDAIVTAWTTLGTYKLREVCEFHIDSSLGSSTHMIFMARKRYNELPAAARDAIDKASGEEPSRAHGRYWDQETDAQRDLVKNSGKAEILTPSAEMSADWNKRIGPVIDDWAKSRPNGEKVLAKYRELLAEVSAGR
jgi:TRAP-type C4-dicarboxylate transport system substrate-binding protein